MSENITTPLRFLDLDGLRLFYNNLKSRMFYTGRSDTEDTIQNKNVIIPGFQLVDGIRILVTFDHPNKASSPTLTIGEMVDGSFNVTGSAAPIYDSTGGEALKGEELRSISGTCEFVYSRNTGSVTSGAWILLANRQKNIFVYSEKTPTNIYEGMVWLKPWGAEMSGDEIDNNTPGGDTDGGES